MMLTLAGFSVPGACDVARYMLLTRNQGRLGRMQGWVIAVNSHPPETHFLPVEPPPKGSRTCPNSTISWGPIVQMHVPTWDISHQSHNNLALIIQPMLEYIISINSE